MDLTAIQRRYDELQRVNRELQSQVERRTSELRRANDELSRQMRQRQRLESEVIEISDREKRKFGQHLHDETCQSLTGLSFLATVIARKLAGYPAAQAAVEELSEELKKLVEQTRDISWSLDPVILNGGLVPALEELSRQVSEKVPCRLNIPSEVTVSDTVALALFQIAKEAAQNAIRHAGASLITVSLRKSRRGLTLILEDNGCGISSSDAHNALGSGIHMMRYRARAIGAELTVENVASGGGRIRCMLPLTERIAPLSLPAKL